MDGKVIGNVNVLDLRKATEASLAGISKVGNVNILIISPETSELVGRLNIGNINATINTPDDVTVKTLTGQNFINKAYFRTLKEKIFAIYIGQTIFEQDVTTEDLMNDSYRFVAVGQVVCPEGIMGILQAKADNLIGQTRSYPELEKVLFNSLTLDEQSLQALADGSEMAVIGSVTMPEVVSNDVLLRKLSKLFVFGEVICHAENSHAIKALLVAGSGSVKVIPEGYEWVEGEIHLDSVAFEKWKDKRIYCFDRVVVDADVAAEVLDHGLGSIISEKLVLVPLALKSVFIKKYDPLKTKVIFYDGELWLVDDDRHLPASRFDYLSGKATLVVNGVLTLDEEIDPKILAGQLAKVHNLGVIHCSQAQMGALQARLGENEGVMDALPGESKEEEENPNIIGNANYLAL